MCNTFKLSNIFQFVCFLLFKNENLNNFSDLASCVTNRIQFESSKYSYKPCIVSKNKMATNFMNGNKVLLG